MSWIYHFSIDLLSYFGNTLGALFVSPGSIFSLTSLLCAAAVATLVIVRRRRAKHRKFSGALLLRVLFPRRLMRSSSTRADLIFLFANVFVYGSIFVWAVLSSAVLAGSVAGGLVAVFGPVRPPTLPQFVLRSTVTLILFLAYELGYWIDHYLSHRLPILWEFHKVHHSASVLTPLTVWRVHPVDSLVFYNILAIVMGLANAFVIYAFGASQNGYSIAGNNLLLVLFIHAYIHLQHSQLWVAFRGLAGRIFMSPAHHQIHHSMNPKHFNSNFGASLAIWDWLFTTLQIPARDPEHLKFGVADGGRDPNTIAELSIAPILRAQAILRGKMRAQLPSLPEELPSQS